MAGRPSGFKTDAARRFRQQSPHAQVELVDDANHLVFIDQTEAVAELLGKFLGAK